MAKAVRSSLNGLRGIERRRFWATVFGIEGPEWMIILALADAEECAADISVIPEMLADLFLDTLPYHAHTTASDA
jgi:hypothetical protein